MPPPPQTSDLDVFLQRPGTPVTSARFSRWSCSSPGSAGEASGVRCYSPFGHKLLEVVGEDPKWKFRRRLGRNQKNTVMRYDPKPAPSIPKLRCQFETELLCCQETVLEERLALSPHSQCSPGAQRWPWPVYCPSRGLQRSPTTHTETNIQPFTVETRRDVRSHRSRVCPVVWAAARWCESPPPPRPEPPCRRCFPALWRPVGGWGIGRWPAPPGTAPCSTRQTEQSSECPAVSPAVAKQTVHVREAGRAKMPGGGEGRGTGSG